jgi:hypothetical protein
MGTLISWWCDDDDGDDGDDDDDDDKLLLILTIRIVLSNAIKTTKMCEYDWFVRIT